MTGLVGLGALLGPPALADVPAPRPGESEGKGKDFIEEARLLSSVVTCPRDQAPPPDLDRPAIEAYCKRMRVSMEKYRKDYIEGASPYITEVRPKDVPKTLVYPFGGGDLLTALTTYPDAREITTLSLEHAGDPRRLKGLPARRLQVSLVELRSMAGGLLVYNDSKSVTLSAAQKSDLPGQLSMFLIALAEHGYRPVSLRFFKLAADGSIHYYDEAEIAALEKTKASRLRTSWDPPSFSEAFSNSEITFVPIDGPAGAPVRTHRHFAADLSDGALKSHPELLKHLEAKGRISAMTKAASYLLWRDDFSLIRDYLLEHMEAMISDSTGIPPKYASKAGFVQDTYGTFAASFLKASPEHNKAFRELWKKNPQRPLPFRYGYIDGARRFHMLVTRKPDAVPPGPAGGALAPAPARAPAGATPDGGRTDAAH